MKLAGKLLLASLLLSAQLAFLAVPPAFAATSIYVSTTGSDTTGTGTLGSPYATVTKAVSVAASGDTILVGPGTYHEMVNITTKVTLMSLSGDPTNTIIDASGLSMGVFIRDAAAAGTVVVGFTVENADNHGIYAQDTSKVIIEHNVVTNNGLNPNPAFSGEDKAINLVGTSYSVIANNQVVNNKFGGIAVNDNGPLNPGFYSPGTLNAAVGNIVSGNVVVGNRPHHCSIVVSAYDQGAGVINNIVSNNIVVDNTAGVVVAANTPNSVAINNSVIFNTIINNGEAGVIVHANSPGAQAIGTLIMGNTISGNGVSFDIKIPSDGPVMISKYTGVLIGGESTAVSPDRTWVIDNVFQNQFNGIFQVNATNTLAYSNIFDATVTHQINGTSGGQDPTQGQINEVAASVSSLQQTLTAKSADLASLTSTVSSLSSSLTQLSSTAAKESDLNDLSDAVASLQSSSVNSGDIATLSYIAYGALVVAIMAILVAVFMSRKGSAPK